MKRVRFISLGCPRNLIDSEVMLDNLIRAGYKIVRDNQSADIFIVNTCSFIKEARIESQEIIEQAIALKKAGKYKRIIVTGCFPQQSVRLLKRTYGGKTLGSTEGKIDALVGVSNRDKIAELCADLTKAKGNGALKIQVKRPLKVCRDDFGRVRLTPRHYAYLRIAEGCNNHCTYCILPSVHGRYRSKTLERVVSEAEGLVRTGVKEINLIAQDTTSYGTDLRGRERLSYLLKTLSGIKKLKWIRLLYTHPAYFTEELVKTVAENDKVVKYLDIPIQHISDPILARMNRHITRAGITDLLGKLRAKIPGLFLRTSILVGFPGETDKDFNTLLDFLSEARFERLGAFKYSQENGTPAARYAKQIPEKIKQERFDAVMSLQQKIAFQRNQEWLGRSIEIIVDEKTRPRLGGFDVGKYSYQGRTYGDAPEVDGMIFISGNNLKIGYIYKAMVTGFKDYDLIGVVK